MKGLVMLIVASAAFVFCAFRESDGRAEFSRYEQVVFTDTLKLDPESKLIIDESLPIVKAQCATVCHSSQFIRVNRLTRDGWKQKIRWMQANHNLWELGETEKTVLDYLEKYYSPTKPNARRAPLKNIQWYKLAQH